MKFIDSQVTSSPGLIEALGYPESISAARVLAQSPGLEESTLGRELDAEARLDANLSTNRLVAWLKQFFTGYQERIVAEVPTLIEILRLDLHVPSKPGCIGTLTVAGDGSSAGEFEVSVFGSGGGGRHEVKFLVEDSIKADRCTRLSYHSLGVWQLIQIVAGPDAGRQFARLTELTPGISGVQSSLIAEPHCDQPARGAGPNRKCFDYSSPSVRSATAKVEIAASQTWKTRLGLKLASLGVDSWVATEVKRGMTITSSCDVQGGHAFEAYTVAPDVFWQWART